MPEDTDSTNRTEGQAESGSIRVVFVISQRDDRALEYAAFSRKTTKVAVVRELLATLPDPPADLAH